jgi:hypothetical protein
LTIVQTRVDKGGLGWVGDLEGLQQKVQQTDNSFISLMAQTGLEMQERWRVIRPTLIMDVEVRCKALFH